jgi:hypothetical protein
VENPLFLKGKHKNPPLLTGKHRKPAAVYRYSQKIRNQPGDSSCYYLEHSGTFLIVPRAF